MKIPRDIRQLVHVHVCEDNLKAHVEVAERYPMLQRPDWPARAAVKVAELLDALPARDRQRVIDLCGKEDAHAAAAEKIVETWSEISPEARDRLWEASKSNDDREQAIAVGLLAKITPNIDIRIVDAKEVVKIWRRAAKCYPGDPENEALLAEAERAQKIYDRLKSLHRQRVEQFEKELTA